MNDLTTTQTEDFPWARKAQRYIAMGQKARALRLLDRVIEYDAQALRRKKDRSEELLRALRYERALVYENFVSFLEDRCIGGPLANYYQEFRKKYLLHLRSGPTSGC